MPSSGEGHHPMKVFYALMLVIQFAIASLLGKKDRMAFLGYLLSDLARR